MQENAELRQQQAAAEERGRKADMRQQADQHKQVVVSVVNVSHAAIFSHGR